MELGIYTFAEATPDSATGKTISPAQRMSNLLEEVELADQVGLDVFGVGEHHRSEYVASSPAVVLAAAAARTKKIRLTSAVTVLSSDDPVRVFQQFATLDLLSNGRAEIMAGRGSFIESYPLFGYDLQNYNELFSEKLELLLQMREEEHVHWSGMHRAALTGQGVYPRPVQNPLPVWIAVGGTPQSVVRAAMHGVPMALAIIGGQPERFVPFVELYREAAREAGQDPAKLPISINSHGYIAETSQQAAEDSMQPFLDTMNRIGKERGWASMTRAGFEAERGPKGALVVGSPQKAIDKIMYEYELFGHQRFMLQFTVGSIPHHKVMRCIELFGTQVAPVIRKEIGVDAT